MPNHIHVIIWITGNQNSRDTAYCVSTVKNIEKFGKPVKRSIPTIIKSYKSAVTKLIHQRDPALKVWQPNYYEQIIRNNNDLEKTREYIRYNAFKRYEI